MWRCCFGKYSALDQDLTSVPHDEISNQEDVIDLSHNNIQALDAEEFSNYSSLTAVHMNYNKLHTIHRTAFYNTSLKKIYLKDNKLQEFPDLVVVAGTLLKVDVADNNIPYIPNQLLSSFKKVWLLILDRNPLSEWPDFTGFNSVSIVTVKNISTLPNMVTPSVCTNVNWLKFRGNLSDVPTISCPAAGRTLKGLSLDGSLLQHNSSFSNLKDSGIGFLHLEQNQMTEFPDLPMTLRQSIWSYLQLSEQKITKIPTSRLSGFKMNRLFLNENNLTDFPCELLNISKELVLSGMKTLSKKEELWRKCLCGRDRILTEEIILDNSMDTVTEFPNIATTFCRSTKELTITMLEVRIYSLV